MSERFYKISEMKLIGKYDAIVVMLPVFLANYELDFLLLDGLIKFSSVEHNETLSAKTQYNS